MRLSINLNETVHFKLTASGIEKYRESYAAYMRIKLTGSTDIVIPTKMMLWQFMEIFGKHFHIGIDPFVEGNNLEVEVSPEIVDDALSPVNLGSWEPVKAQRKESP